MKPRIKICGIRDEDDLDVAVFAGADAVGFIVGCLFESEDEITEKKCAELILKVPPYISSVVVTHLEDPDQIVNLLEKTKPDILQAHSLIEKEVIEEIKKLWSGQIISLVFPGEGDYMKRARDLSEVSDAILLDSKKGNRIGSPSQTHDWNLSLKIKESVAVPVILAGGLNAQNIAEAIRKVSPFAVDLNSGVDDDEGRKELFLAEDFVRAVSEA